MMGLALPALHYNIGGSDVRGFASGILLGLSIGEMLVGIYVVAGSAVQQKNKKINLKPDRGLFWRIDCGQVLSIEGVRIDILNKKR